ncbi:hypothetical protein ACJPQX_20925 [Vibrio vulnificus]|uniref:hypothetical protein n=1 Tax=Vibrio vulnificus TaxID=672 RepID=UPI003D9CAE49
MNNELEQLMAALPLYLRSCANEIEKSISNNDELSLAYSINAASQSLNLAVKLTSELIPKSDIQASTEAAVKSSIQETLSQTQKTENFVQLFGRVYKVRNQNGFNNALYHSLGCAENDGKALYYTKKELRESVQNWPERYPALVEFEDKMLECKRVYVSVSYDVSLSGNYAN